MRVIFLLCFIATVAAAEPLKFSSGENRTHLLELFSSEGCSSCPPAEARLGALRNVPGLWRDFVPVSFHVSYWDRLGWTDRWAKKDFTARQYAYAEELGTESVYTPEFILNGVEWRAKSERNSLRVSPEKGAILSAEYGEDGVCRVRFAGAGDYEAYAAILGAGIFTDVRAGENKGRKLRHDFVVLSLQKGRLKAGLVELKLSKSTESGIERQALAVWVTRRGKLAPVQATGGWLD